jgi:hypothetical protein
MKGMPAAEKNRVFFWKKKSHEGKIWPLRRWFFQSRFFWGAFKNKVQIFSCRTFARFLICSRWQRASAAAHVNKL